MFEKKITGKCPRRHVYCNDQVGSIPKLSLSQP